MSAKISNPYDKRYAQDNFYWGLKPSALCYEILKHLPPEKSPTALDMGCGEGRNAVFLARNGYRVWAFDLSAAGVEKTRRYAEQLNLPVAVFQTDINSYRLQENYDILFSTGTMHYIRPELRDEIIANYKTHTPTGGLNVYSILIEKPFIPRAPDADVSAALWKSGEILTYYHDWEILFFEETIFDCNSSGIPHRHAVNRIVARKI
ncbi:MAG: methyltransferase domain-containing protein [Planctomycetes bacterium]|nr:methyltransferase domain-containing protein [Planctomycetota bacterium]